MLLEMLLPEIVRKSLAKYINIFIGILPPKDGSRLSKSNPSPDIQPMMKILH